MAFKLTKSEEARRIKLRDDLIEAREVMMTEVAQQEDRIRAAVAAINRSFENYNEVLQEARGFVEDIHAERDDEFEERSERWQEGDRGDEAREWLDALQEVIDAMEDIAPVEIDPFEIDPENHAELLDDMPEGAG